MASSKCKQCGLVNPFNAPVCKRCGVALGAEENQEQRQAADIPDALHGIEDESKEKHDRQAGDNADAPPAAEEEAEKKKDEPLGFWGCVQMLIFLSIAGAVTGYLGTYILDFLPSGRYPVVLLIAIFIPAAIVGAAAGGLVIYPIYRLTKAVKGKKGEEATKEKGKR